jgi:hypothetical protein
MLRIETEEPFPLYVIADTEARIPKRKEFSCNEITGKHGFFL